MADYWKSLPRKFCEYCKCWLTDNKPSIEFHERGKKHQENVKLKIAEIRKKGQKDYEAKQTMQKDMLRMEQAALAAIQKDLEANPALVGTTDVTSAATSAALLADIPIVPNPAPTPSGSKQNKKGKKPQKTRQPPKGSPPKSPSPASRPQLPANTGKSSHKWMESVSEDGDHYYWNLKTGESQWDPPEEGFVALADQEKRKGSKEEPLQFLGTPSSEIGPQPRPDPYGQWVSIVNDSDTKAIDLQLPVTKEANEYKVITPSEEPRMKFKEKVVTSLNDKTSDVEIGFKKRKKNFHFKRNIRRKDDDDEG